MPGPYWCIRLTTRVWKNRLLYRLPPMKDYAHHVLLHVVPITTHTHDRRKSIGKKKQRIEKKVKERKDKTRKRKNEEGKERKKKKRQEKQEKTRQEEEATTNNDYIPCARVCIHNISDVSNRHAYWNVRSVVPVPTPFLPFSCAHSCYYV